MTTETASKVESLVQHLENVQKFVSTVWVKYRNPDRYVEFRVSLKREPDGSGEWRNSAPSAHFWRDPQGDELFTPCCPNNCPKDIPDAFNQLKGTIGDGEPIIDTLLVQTENPELPVDGLWSDMKSLRSTDALYRLAQQSWMEVLQIQAPSGKAKKPAGPTKVRKALMGQLVLASLDHGVSAWNNNELISRWRTFDEADFSGKQLDDIQMSAMEAKGARFDGASLKNALMSGSDFSSSSFVDARFEDAHLDYSKFVGADFSRAALTRTTLAMAKLHNAKFHDAEFIDANLYGADLCGADLTNARIDKNTQFQGAKYDDATKLPPNFSQWSKLEWKGNGPDPFKQSIKDQIDSMCDTDFEGFMERLKQNFDEGRVANAIKMLKKDAFQLYSDCAPDVVAGIVKSQRDSGLIYACRLSTDGHFSCCTQNLVACGGLRGALCKHILVLIIGLAKTGQIDSTKASQWVLSSRVQKPKLHAELMTETFLKYKGAESGEIDWRPTETIPEDYYAF